LWAVAKLETKMLRIGQTRFFNLNTVRGGNRGTSARDVRAALRLRLKNPGFSAVVILRLAVKVK